MDASEDARAFAVIDLLLTVGHIDGLLHADEQSFIRHYMERLVEQMASPPSPVPAAEWRARFEAAYATLNTEIEHLAAEVSAVDDRAYVPTRLKVRAVALFRGFSPSDQAVALELLQIMMLADGEVVPVEKDLHDELLAYFHAAPTLLPPVVAAPEDLIQIDPVQPLPLIGLSHPMIDVVEQRYADDPAKLAQQVAADYNLVFGAISVWERARAKGNGTLLGVADIAQLPPGTRALDGHVHVMRPDRPVELIVLGDLHGCYSCLKAALLQSNFIERALAHQRDPANNADIKLVLLGDYIDRGRWSFDGILRAALQLLVQLPDHVILLRGNHELFVRVRPPNGQPVIRSAVNPAEAIPSATGRVPYELLEAYRHLFDHMPASFLFERTLFVHGGIPRDGTLAERFTDLSSLEDPIIRFEMMWSDPVDTDVVPSDLQRESPRFNFGREQFRHFMERIGCHTLFRGHEQIDTGFATMFDTGHRRLHTLFSAGGRENADLPAESRYRNVTPMGLTIRAGGGHGSGVVHAIPWPLEYKPFNLLGNNGFYR